MKKLKKILAFVLSMAMVLGMGVTSFAATPGNDDGETFGFVGDRGDVTLGGISEEEGIEIKLYPLLQADYDNVTGFFKGYVETQKTVTVTEKDENNEDKEVEKKVPLYDLAQYKKDESYAFDRESLDVIGAIAYSDDAAIPLSDVEWTYSAADGGYKAENCVPVGMYLVSIAHSNLKIYSYAVVSVYYKLENGANSISGGVLDLVNGSSIVKAAGTPEVDKKVSDTEDGEGTKGNTANIGDTLYYSVNVDPIPYYGGQNPVFKLVDTLSKGLTLDNDSVEITIINRAKTEKLVVTTQVNQEEKLVIKAITKYVKEEGAADFGTTGVPVTSPNALENIAFDVATDKDGKTVLSVDFVKTTTTTENEVTVTTKNYLLNAYEGGTLDVKYSAELNDQAVINAKENGNTVKLQYTKDSREDKDNPDTVESKTYTYTFDIDGAVKGDETTQNKVITEGILNKVGESTGATEVVINGVTVTDALQGAEFTLYKVDPDKFTGSAEELAEQIYTNDVFNGTVGSDERGQLPIKGLKAGTYYLKETKAPAGYSLNAHVFKIEIHESLSDEGILESWYIEIDGNENNRNTFTVEQGTKTTVHINKTVVVEGEGENQKEVVSEGKINGVTIANTKMASLPSTGGIGTTIFTVGGCAIMVIAAALFFVSRRKSSKQS